MTELEQLENEAYEDSVDVIRYPFKSKRIRGLYCDRIVALNNALDTDTEKKCILAEELGHYNTTVGNILDQSTFTNRKQERNARIWAYDKLIGITGLINAYKADCKSLYEIAEYLDVTEPFLLEAIGTYKQKYGPCTTIDNYVIYFEPHLGVLELI